MTRLFGALVPLLAITFCVVLFSLVSANTAEAHTSHQPELVQVAATSDDDGTSTFGLKVLLDCGFDCCSPAHCTSGITSGENSAFFSGRLADAFLPPRETQALPFDQSNLKRPPRS